MQRSEVKIFVCGSMDEGLVHYKRIAPYVTSKESAIAEGFSYRLPVGFHVYVATVGDPKATRVRGTLFTVNAPDVLWAILDEFYGVHSMAPERGLHFKASINVQTLSGEVSKARVYSFNPKKVTKKFVLIRDGNWRADLESNPPLTTQISERQAQYVVKLGQTKGREIIPIDLKLYRELLNLDLIVDKGRRLALTKLGKEVCYYIN